MDSWAEDDVTYPSNNADVPNKTEPKQELQATGFAPTYIDSGGNLVIGDGVTAQHMNYIICDLYRKYRELRDRIQVLEGGAGG
ncbi:hypothetical protein [Yersinia pekkanenii]|uniref:Phosphoglycolate phosphatase n=1 Tax=Yersinia pekkanenii TaxID=1288385 RepID=A0A0T9P9Z0_9GAMM|nr:hypothetical protein [Yersinia pekkanenii]CNH53532.1 Uncharacterised protein [Yersinia pekkanenii]CRY67550.1 Uncharacterised protein [Yersinia pekkanenii]